MRQAFMFREHFRTTLACVVLAAFPSAGTSSVAYAGTPAPTLPAPTVSTAPPAPLPPADIVVLIDGSVSTSLDRADVFHLEQTAAAAIAVSEPNPDSRVAVTVFGTRDRSTADPTDEPCLATRLGTSAERSAAEPADEREALLSCIAEQNSRGTDDAGADFPAALRHALALLGDDDGMRDEIIFVLSDGVLGVGESPYYPFDPVVGKQDRNRHALESLDRLLAEDLNPRGVQVRPIAVGRHDVTIPGLVDELDGAQLLATLAAGGGPGRCPADAALPPVISGPSHIEAARVATLALTSARCLPPRVEAPLPDAPGGATEFRVDVPLWADAATLTVVGADDRTDVRFIPPGAPLPAEPTAGVTRESDGRVAAFHAERPVPGVWRIQVPAGQQEPLAAFVAWSSTPAAALHADPARPGIETAGVGGEQVEIALTARVFSVEKAFGATLRASGSAGATAHRDDLLSLQVTVMVTGDGLEDPMPPVDLRGRVPDPDVGDVAEFTGTVKLPPTLVGALRYEAVIQAGPGGPVVHRVVQTFVGDPREKDPVKVAELPSGTTVTPAGSVPLELSWGHGYRSDSKEIGLRLRDITVPGVSVAPDVIPTPANHGTRTIPRLRVPEEAPPGHAHGVLEVFDPTHPEVVLSMTWIDLDVVGEEDDSGALGRVGVAAVIAVVLTSLLAAMGYRRRRKRHPVNGLCLWLERGDVFEDYLQARDDEGTELYFDIVDADTRTPRFARAKDTNNYTGVLRGTTGRDLFQIFWSSGAKPDEIWLDGKSNTTYGNLIVEVTRRHDAVPAHPVDGNHGGGNHGGAS